MIVYPNCKINLGLHILKKRTDGFHNLESVFYPVALHDIVEIVPSDRLELECYGLKIDCDEKTNLCLKAYNILYHDFKLPPVRIILYKNIPFGSGLGGGSSDAAFTLMTLNNLFKLKLSQSELLKYAAALGSDCSFFIINKPCLASQKGDVLDKIETRLDNKYVLLAKPNFNISTADAYAAIKPDDNRESLLKIYSQPLSKWKANLKNDFETYVFSLFPEMENIKQKFYDAGAIYASMSGSGSALFGIFEHLPENPFGNEVVFSRCIKM